MPCGCQKTAGASLLCFDSLALNVSKIGTSKVPLLNLLYNQLWSAKEIDYYFLGSLEVLLSMM